MPERWAAMSARGGWCVPRFNTSREQNSPDAAGTLRAAPYTLTLATPEEQIDAERHSVLVITADPSIEALVGELVAFAGYRAVFDTTVGAAGEPLRRQRPDIALIDTSLPRPVFRACVDAAAEVGAPVVLVSSWGSARELASDAATEQCAYFVLPGGPVALADVLSLALHPHKPDVTGIPDRLVADRAAHAVHPAMCAALASVARAHLLRTRAQSARDRAGALGERSDDAMRAAHRSHDALRAAVTDFVAILKHAHVPEAEMIIRLRHTVEDCSAIMGAEAALGALLLESEHWAHEAYAAA